MTASTQSSPSQTMLAAALWSSTAFAAVYLLQGALHLTGLIYDPAAHHWLVAPAPTGVQMRYYSDFGGAAVAAVLAFAIRFRWKSATSDLWVLTGAMLSVVAFDLVWFISRVLSAMRN